MIKFIILEVNVFLITAQLQYLPLISKFTIFNTFQTKCKFFLTFLIIELLKKHFIEIYST